MTFNSFSLQQVTGSPPDAITTGPDGNLWFTLNGYVSSIGTINPATHALKVYSATGIPPAADLNDITSGPDGNLWYTDDAGGPLGEINPTTHVVSNVALPNASSVAHSITTGPDGNLWFTEVNGGSSPHTSIGQLNPTTHAIAEFTIPGGFGIPKGITTGSDGNLWFTDMANTDTGPEICEINPTTHLITEFGLPFNGAKPGSMITGPDGNLWFTDRSNNAIGEFNLTTKTASEFPVSSQGGEPSSISNGPGGNIWFTEPMISQSLIGEIDPTNHQITLSPLPATTGEPTDITNGPDGNLWFGGVGYDLTNNQINQAVVSTSATPFPTTTSTLSATPNPSILKQPVTLTATVSVATGSSGTPTGLVSFMDGSSDLGDVTLTNGVATLTTTDLPLGLNTITAIFGGEAGQFKGSGSLSLVEAILPVTPVPPVTPITPITPVVPVNPVTPVTPVFTPVTPVMTLVTPAVSTIVVTSSAGSVVMGQPITYSATVTPVAGTAGTPSGAVAFLEGTTVLGLVPVDASGHASLRTIALLAGSETITAVYGGDATFAVSIGTTIQAIDALPAPKLVKLQIRRAHEKPTSLVLTFDEPLNPTTVKKLTNYRFADARSRRIALKSATYNSVDDSVTLVPSRKLNVRRTYHLRVTGAGPTGVAGANGSLLDGVGESGTNFATLIDPATLTFPKRGAKATGSLINVNINAKS